MDNIIIITEFGVEIHSKLNGRLIFFCLQSSEHFSYDKNTRSYFYQVPSELCSWNLRCISNLEIKTNVVIRKLNLHNIYILWSHGSWIYNYLCNQCLSPLMWVRISIRARCTTLCDKVWSVTCDRLVVFSRSSGFIQQ